MFNFDAFYKNIDIPVIVYQRDTKMQIVYENHSAVLQFNPLADSGVWDYKDRLMEVNALLKMDTAVFSAFCSAIETEGDVSNFHTVVTLYTGERSPVVISANPVAIGAEEYIQMYIRPVRQERAEEEYPRFLTAALDVAYKAETTDESINSVLAFAGEYIKVSRSYIFEAVSDNYTSNTYEWCAPGITPEIANLQNLRIDAYSYNEIIKAGLAVTDDIRQLGKEDRAILEPQGIKSLAVIPIYFRGAALGYVGFDDCRHYRKWSPEEMQLLQGLADMLASLLVRRNAERSIRYSMEALRIVTDNFNTIVYVSNARNHEILFANRALAETIQRHPDALLGANAFDIVKEWSNGAFENCSMDTLVDAEGNVLKTQNSWEFFNTADDCWYLVHNTIIKWINGENAVLTILTDVTDQKTYEENLKHVASIDMMTGLYNRERGRQFIQDIMESDTTGIETSLIFIDLDGLKVTNDCYGHEMGDRFILKTIEFIQSRIRKTDKLCRWGGDEFILILDTNNAAAHRVIQDIQRAMQMYNDSGESVFTLSFSYGIIEIPRDTQQSVEDVVKLADDLMYMNKEEKRAQTGKL